MPFFFFNYYSFPKNLDLSQQSLPWNKNHCLLSSVDTTFIRKHANPKKGAGGLIIPPQWDPAAENSWVLMLIPQEWQNKRTDAATPVLCEQTGQPPSPKLGGRVPTGLQPVSQLHILEMLSCGQWLFIVASWINSEPTDSQVNPDFHWQYRIKSFVWCPMQKKNSQDWDMNGEIKKSWAKKKGKTCSSSTQQFCICSLGHDTRE